MMSCYNEDIFVLEEYFMKYCLDCGRELFDRDEHCDKCGSKNFLDGDSVNAIIKELSISRGLKKRKLLQNSLYNAIYENIINKPTDNYRMDLNTSPHESHEEYFQRINSHTINSAISKPEITCPYCHSTNTKKIGQISRAASIGFWGIASKKIGKQWHCENCGSDF